MGSGEPGPRGTPEPGRQPTDGEPSWGAVMTDASEPGTIRVLIADDQRVVREGLSMLVALLGDVLTALPWS